MKHRTLHLSEEEYTAHKVKMIGIEGRSIQKIVGEMEDVYLSSRDDPHELAKRLDYFIDALNYTTSKLQKHYKELCDNTDYESEYM